MSHLKKPGSPATAVSSVLPNSSTLYQVPESILDIRMIKRGDAEVPQVLIKWCNMALELAGCERVCGGYLACWSGWYSACFNRKQIAWLNKFFRVWVLRWDPPPILLSLCSSSRLYFPSEGSNTQYLGNGTMVVVLAYFVALAMLAWELFAILRLGRAGFFRIGLMQRTSPQ
jgi:hypothetical protein